MKSETNFGNVFTDILWSLGPSQIEGSYLISKELIQMISNKVKIILAGLIASKNRDDAQFCERLKELVHDYESQNASSERYLIDITFEKMIPVFSGLVISMHRERVQVMQAVWNLSMMR
jgi:hypothetical protein